MKLARHGARVVVNDISVDNAQAVAQEVQQLERQSLAVCADVSNETEVQDMVRETAVRFGRIDILVNNAGVVTTGPMTEITTEIWIERWQLI
jgi:NAD(P)-dependent dehydrogenase (short-subunit alcohol dehydrogenase family)